MKYPFNQTQNFFTFFNLGLLCLLTLFGSYFSKLNLGGPVYAHDLLLALAALGSLIFTPKRFPFWPILVLGGFGLIYLVYSFARNPAEAEMIVRQFAIFGYLGCAYLLNRNDNPVYFKIIEKFILLLAFASVILQSMSVAAALRVGIFNPLNSNSHIWYSYMVVSGLVITSASVLMSNQNKILKAISWSLVLGLGWSTGHASAQLAMVAILIAFIILKLNGWQKLIPIALSVLLLVIFLYKFPQLKDRNSDWRLISWEYHITDLVEKKYALVGNGFGVPYTNDELEMILYKKIGSTVLSEQEPNERYLSPPHNSFITFCFAIGLIPGLLIWIPYSHAAKHLSQQFDATERFNHLMLLCLIGLTVWSSFNVVLELPHSSGFFWLVYFTYWKIQSKQSPLVLNA